MNRYRQRLNANATDKSSNNDSGSVDTELTGAAESVYDTAAQHRKCVKKKDEATRARRKCTRRG